MAARGMTQARMKQHKDVKVRVERLEHARGVQRVVVLDERAHLHVAPQPVLDDGAERIGGGPRWQWELVVAVHHCFGPD